MKTITIQEILRYLKSKDRRTARKWCANNEVELIEHGKNEFAFESEFIEAFEKPMVQKLKRKFGKDWESVYRMYKDGDIPALSTLNDLTSAPVNIYKANNNNKSKFLKKLEEYENKKKNAA